MVSPSLYPVIKTNVQASLHLAKSSCPVSLSMLQGCVVNFINLYFFTNSSRVWQDLKLSDVSVGTRPRYSLVVGEDVKKTNQLNKIRICRT